MTRRHRVGTLAASMALAMASGGCDVLSRYAGGWLQERVPAPVTGGEKLTYRLEGSSINSVGTITLEATGNGYWINASSPAYAAQRVGVDLRPAYGFVDAFNLGILWLPPEEHVVGNETFAGLVTQEKTLGNRDVVMVSGNDLSSVVYAFDRRTGFMVSMRRLNMQATLVSSTVANLR